MGTVWVTEKKGYPATPKTLGEEIRKRRLDLNLRLYCSGAGRIICHRAWL